MSNSKPIIIIGSGLAGYSLAREFRKLNKQQELIIISSDDGRNYSKPMLSNAISQEKTANTLTMADPGKMSEILDATIRINTEVTDIDPHNRLIFIGSETIAFDRLVLATGATPNNQEIPGDAGDHVFTVNSLQQFAHFQEHLSGKKRVLVLGGGLIGCEFANDLAAAGFQVQLVSPGNQLMERLLPTPVSQQLQQSLEELGVQFYLGPLVNRMMKTETGIRTWLTNGQELESDIVLSAIGLRPNITLAQEAGLVTGHGIKVNRYLETNFSHIFALGDCAEVEGHVLLYVLPLMSAARALAATLNGTPMEVHYPAMPVVVKTPACPIVIQAPIPGQQGQWSVEENESGIKALYTKGDQLLGFALTREYVKERMALTKQVPGLL
ncbi:FAD-dependent oxidoreductase [Gynuella sp.]|uniref:FAD-dependent oxidoreductase n=1 Tax=Gynuella sp. TaxID=2969146 RepID=UPI003D11CD9A